MTRTGSTLIAFGAFAGLCFSALAPFAEAQTQQVHQQESTSVAVFLIDGSVICGTLASDSMRLDSTAGVVQISFEMVTRIARTSDGSAVAVFRNGDRLTGRLEETSYKLESVLGELNVPWSTVMHLEPMDDVLPQSDLLVHLDFEQSPRLQDQGPNAFRVRTCGSIQRTDGVAGRAGVFDAGDWVDVMAPLDSGAFPTTEPFSVAAWFMTEWHGEDAQQSIISTHSAGDGNDGFYFYVDHGPEFKGRVRWWVGPGVPGDFSAVSRTPVNDGDWHHIVGTYNGSETRLYIDGVLHDCKDVEGRPYYDSTPWWRIGHSVNNNMPWAEDAKYQFHGAIDEVRLYRGVLDPTAVRVLHTSTQPGGG